jgi:hypothetical protein
MKRIQNKDEKGYETRIKRIRNTDEKDSKQG